MVKQLQMKMLLLVAILMGWGAGAWAESNVSTVSTKFSTTGNVTNNFTQTGDFTSAAWNLAVTWKSNASWQNLDSNKGAQIGSGSSPATQIVLTGKNVPGTITSVVVNTSGANSIDATVSVSVGTTAFKCNNQTTASLTNSATDYTFGGSSSGDVVITWNNSSSKAIYIKSITINYTTTSVCAAPTFSPTPGLYASAQNVTINTETADADIYYTTNGSDPTTNSSKYSSPISVSETTTIKAMAVKSGCENSVIESATYVILQHAGTEADPYTVADARAAIDAGQGITGVYAKGFVSEIVTAHNGTNISFNIVNEKGDQVSLQAYKCTGTESANVAVGDEVVVSGNLTKYNTIYEFSQGCTLVSRTPSAWPSINVATTTINAPCDAVDGTLDVTYKNIADATYDVQFCDANGGALEGDAPDWVTLDIDNDHNVAYHIEANQGQARSTCFKVCAVMGDVTAESDIITINQAKYVVPASLPFNWAGGASSGLTALDGVTANGLGSDYAPTNAPYLTKLDGDGDYIQVYCNQRPGQVTIGVKMLGGADASSFTVQGSADGETFHNIETLTISGAQNDVLTLETSNPFAATDRYVRLLFTKGSNVGVGPISIDEFVQSITVNPDEVNAPYVDASGSLDITYQNLTVSASDFNFACYNSAEAAENGGDADLIGWIQEINVSEPQQGEGYSLNYTLADNDGAARTAFVRLYVEKDDEEIYSIVTINQAAAPAYYTLTVEPLENMELFVFAGDESEPLLEGAGNAQVLSGTEVMLSVDPSAGYSLQSLMVDGEEHAGDINGGMYIFNMPDHNVTVSATVVEIESVTYTLASSITSGKKYIIVSGVNNEGKAKAMGVQKTNNRGAVEVTVEDNEITVASYDVYEFEINDLNESNDNGELYSIYDNRANEDEGGYLYAASSSSNHLKTKAALDDNGKWTISFNENGVPTIKAQGSNTRNLMRFNSSDEIFSCYASGQQDIYLYEKVEEEQPLTKTITDAQWATYVAPKTVMIPVGLKAYIVTAADAQKGVTLTPVHIVGEGTPLVLNGAANTYTFVETGEPADDTSANLLCVVTANTPNITEAYVLAKPNAEAEVKFYHYVNANDPLDAGQVYLPVEAVVGNGNGVRELDIDVPSSISTMSIEQSAMNNTVYDLQGRTVVQPTKGLYIVNGKKVIIK